jgi:hypothetical protein
MDSYFRKYLKYKNKYLQAVGGAEPGECKCGRIEQTTYQGKNFVCSVCRKSKTSNNFAFPKGGNLYVMLPLFLQQNISAYKERRYVLLDGKPVDTSPHITLLSLQINMKHPSNYIFNIDNVSLQRTIKNAFRQYLKDITLTHTYAENNYGKLTNWYAKEYIIKKKETLNAIKSFRDYIYKKTGATKLKSENGFVYYELNGKLLFAVNDFNADTKWSPHVSLASFSDIRKANGDLEAKLRGETNNNKIKGTIHQYVKDNNKVPKPNNPGEYKRVAPWGSIVFRKAQTLKISSGLGRDNERNINL